MVLVVIASQLQLSTSTDVRVARNDVGITTMDLAIESALLQVYENLKEDAEAGGGEAGGGGLPADPGAAADPTAAGAGAGGGAVDSKEDDWATPDRTSIGTVDLRILIQDEDSKINVLGMLTQDEDEAQKVYERVVRVIETFRGDTSEEVDSVTAERLASAMRDFLLERTRLDDELPLPALLTNDPEDPDRGMLLSLRELTPVVPFHPGLFRDFRTEDGEIVHSLASYLTVWSSVGTFDEFQRDRDTGTGEAAPESEPEAEGQAGGGQEAGPPDESGQAGQPGQEGQEGQEASAGGETQNETQTANGERGVAVNLNTAPPVVLKALFDDRDVDPRFWDDVVEYRNLEDEEAEAENEDAEPVYDEFGNEIIQRQVFDDVGELGEVDGYLDIAPDVRADLERLLTVESHVFTIFVTARIKGPNDEGLQPRNRAEAREMEESSGGLSRTVRSVVWRRQGDDGWEIVPIVRWEVLDYSPYEVLDYPDEDR